MRDESRDHAIECPALERDNLHPLGGDGWYAWGFELSKLGRYHRVLNLIYLRLRGSFASRDFMVT